MKKAAILTYKFHISLRAEKWHITVFSKKDSILHFYYLRQTKLTLILTNETFSVQVKVSSLARRK